MLRTPIYQDHVDLGAKIVEFGGWMMPLQYTGIIEEHEAVRSSAGLFDVSHMGQIRVHGEEAISRLQKVLSNDLERISEIGKAQYSLLLNENGGIIDDLIVYRIADAELLLVVNAANREADIEYLTDVLGLHSDNMVDETFEWAMFALQGPKALEVLHDLGVDARELAPFSFMLGELDGYEIFVAATGYTGERGCEIMVSAHDASQVWKLLLKDDRVLAIGLGARDTLRLEAGYPLHGNEISVETNPFDAGLGFAAPKGVHDALDQLRKQDRARKLVALKASSRGIPRSGCAVRAVGDEEIVGEVTSGTMSPSLRTGIALAYVAPALGQVGTELEIDVRGRAIEAKVVERPFVQGSLHKKTESV